MRYKRWAVDEDPLGPSTVSCYEKRNLARKCLPRRGRLWCSETDMHIRFIVNSFQTDKKQSLHQIRCRDCFYSSLDFPTMPQIMSTHCSMPRVLVSRQMS